MALRTNFFNELHFCEKLELLYYYRSFKGIFSKETFKGLTPLLKFLLFYGRVKRSVRYYKFKVRRKIYVIRKFFREYYESIFYRDLEPSEEIELIEYLGRISIREDGIYFVSSHRGDILIQPPYLVSLLLVGRLIAQGTRIISCYYLYL